MADLAFTGAALIVGAIVRAPCVGLKVFALLLPAFEGAEVGAVDGAVVGWFNYGLQDRARVTMRSNATRDVGGGYIMMVWRVDKIQIGNWQLKG